jgi:hypothetical protein
MAYCLSRYGLRLGSHHRAVALTGQYLPCGLATPHLTEVGRVLVLYKGPRVSYPSNQLNQLFTFGNHLDKNEYLKVYIPPNLSLYPEEPPWRVPALATRTAIWAHTPEPPHSPGELLFPVACMSYVC